MNFKYLLQKIFRKNHTSDWEVWGLFGFLAKTIYPKLLAFKKYKRQGIPIFNNDDGDKKLWEETLDKMLFSFEYILYDERNISKKKKLEFEKKYGDIHEKIPSNKQYFLWVKREDHYQIISNPSDLTQEDIINLEKEQGSDYLEVNSFYYNIELDKDFKKKCQEGLELFGKYFWNLWD